ncbi:MAG: hypothetical protein M3R18_05125 [Pseudomonadota bacterium]|nr:hypothetical protein [Pseudomonadota bacterium]
MTILKTHALALAAVMVAMTAFSAPSFAQSYRFSAGSSVPGYVQSTPEKHWVDDGGGRFSVPE